jgi:hypothetical protein
MGSFAKYRTKEQVERDKDPRSWVWVAVYWIVILMVPMLFL